MSFKTGGTCFGLAALAAVMALAGGANALADKAAEARVDASRALYKTAISELDPNGDVLVYANLSGMIRRGMGLLDELLSAVGAGDKDVKDVRDALRRAGAFMEQSGLYDFNSFGMSVAPREDGLHDYKVFYGRKPTKTPPLFWKMIAPESRKLQGPNLLPADTALFMAGASDLQATWDFIRSAVATVGGTNALTAMDGMIALVKLEKKIDIPALVQSMGDESFLGITLHDKKTFKLPLPPKPMAIPEPAILVGLKVRNDAMLKLLLQAAKGAQVAVAEDKMDGSILYTMQMSAVLPFEVKPCMIQKDGWLLIGSSPASISNSLAAARSKSGIRKSPALKRLGGEIPSKATVVGYVDERFAKLMNDIQLRMLEMEGGEQAELLAFQRKIYEWFQQGPSFYTMDSRPDGVLVRGVSNQSGKQMAAAMMVAPLGLVAGVALPAIMEARTKAQGASDEANLEAVATAKAMFVEEHEKKKGDRVTEADLAPYLPDGKLPPLKMGTYRLNPVGKPVEIVLPDGGVIKASEE